MFEFLTRKKRANAADAQKPSPPSSLKPSLLSLEQRLMFDAAAAATAAEVKSEQVAQEQAEAAVSSEPSADSPAAGQTDSHELLHAIASYTPGESTTEVAFVDPTVPDYQSLIAGMGPNVEVVMLDAARDGMEQIAESLAGRTGVDAIHLISHGRSGALHLGAGTLTTESMSGEYAGELAAIREALSEHADLLVYGCDFAEGQTGLEAVQRLADVTGADVQASTDQTGHLSLGGDWEFEVRTGVIETNVAVTDSVQMNWAGLLGAETVQDNFSTQSYRNNDGTQSWSTSWSETDASGGGAGGGDVRVNSSQLQIDTDAVGNAASRGVNLSGATSATLTFSYNNTLTGADRIEARVSTDGGATYVTLAGGAFSSALNTGSGSASFDISGYASSNTRIQFIVTGTGGGDRLYVDNVQISYTVPNNAPAISSNGGGTTASVTVAENSTTVTTVTATDADAGQTLSYSIAGGADAATFTINSSTGQLSFVSAPNYEAPTDSGGNNVYDVTVQVSDGNGGTDTQALAVTVAGTNEAPTDIVQSAGTGIDLNADGGNNSYLYTTSGGAILGGRTAFSIEAQFSSTSTPVSGEHRTLLSYATTGSANEVRVGIAQTSSSTCQLTLTINNSRVDLSGYDASRLFDGGQHQLGVTWSATNGGYNFYVDGQQVGSGTGLQTGYTTRSTGTLVVGMDQDSVGGGFQTSQVFKGTLQDVRVFNDVRTAAEISAYLYQDVASSESGLVADWTMNNLSGGSTSDVVAGRHLIVGSVSESGWVASTPSLTWSVAENAATGTVVGTVTGTDPDAGDSKSYSLTDTAGGRFAVNSSTGQLTVADGSLLNYEAATSHSVTVRVTDSGGLTYDETFMVNLMNVNEAPTDLALSSNSVAENAANGTVVGTVTGSDVDTGETKSYSLTDTAGGRFAVNSSTGVLTVADGSLLNYESATNHSVTVRVTDSGGLTYDETFTVNLTNVNEAPTGADATVTLTEDTAHTLTTANFGFSDVDAGDSLSAVRLDTLPSAGSLTLSGVAVTAGQVVSVADITAGNLVFTPVANATGTGYASVTFSVRDSHSAYDAAPNTLTFDVTAVNDAPTDLSLSSNTVAENAVNGTVIGTVTGTDPDAGDSKSYSLTDTAGGRFAVNSSTGQITVADGSLLNYEAATSHSVTVRVTDSGGLTYDETFTVNLTNVNEAPTITSNGGGGTATLIVVENQTAVTTVTATDVDAGTALTYSIAGGADSTRFSIDAATGALRFSAAPNFERPNDAGLNNVYDVTVQVSDGQGGTDTQSISVRVTNVNEAPTITSNRGGDVAAVTIRENSTTVTTVRATDPDRGTRLTYSVIGGADAALFSINSRTGALRFISAPNFERPADTDLNNVYHVVVQAADGQGGSDAQTISVTVTDRNDAPRELDFTGGVVAEGAPNGTIVGQALVSDEDRVDTATFSLVDNAGGRFSIHPGTGIITVANNTLIDYDLAASHTVSVRVMDAGRLARTETFTIAVTNTNETPADIVLAGDTVHENASAGTVVGTVTTQDSDASDTHTYSLVNDAGGRFAVDQSTGEITVADGSLLDHEGNTSHSVTVRSTDSGGLMIDRTFTITVSNVNEAPTALSLSSRAVAENAVTGTVVGTASATDADAGDAHTYQLLHDAGGRFAIDRNTGVITVADGTLLDYEAATSHSVTVRVTDAGGLTHDQVLAITVTDVHDGLVPGPLLPGTPPPIVGTPAPLASSGPVGPGPADGPTSTPTASFPDAARSVSLAAAPVLRPGPVREGETLVVLEDDREPIDWTVVEPALNLLHEAADQLRMLAQPSEIPATLSEFIVKELDAMTASLEDAMQGRQDEDTLIAATAAGVSVVLSAGYLVWALRGGWLVASLMATMPAWRSFDPLPVLVRAKEDRAREGESDDRRAPRREDQQIEHLFGSEDGRAA